MMYKEQLKNIAYFLGKSLGILALIYIFYTLSQEYTLSTFMESFYDLLSTLPLLFALNLLSIVVGIYAWHIMLLHYTDKPFKYILSYYYFTKTEIAKYLPGNIFHFIGRQALASRVGITQIQMAKISTLFTFLLLAGTIFSSTLFFSFTSYSHKYLMICMLLASVVAIVVVRFTYTSFPFTKKIKMNVLLTVSISIQGIMLAIIIMQQSETFSISQFYLIASIYIISWLIGFVTPGASGGLGVREGTFIAISSYLHIGIPSDIIVFSVLLVRLVNIFTDILTYLSTFALTNKIKHLKR